MNLIGVSFRVCRVTGFQISSHPTGRPYFIRRGTGSPNVGGPKVRSILIWAAKSPRQKLSQLLVGLLADFMALAEGRSPSDNPALPRLDLVGESATLIARAWEAREFRGEIAGGFRGAPD